MILISEAEIQTDSDWIKRLLLMPGLMKARQLHTILNSYTGEFYEKI